MVRGMKMMGGEVRSAGSETVCRYVGEAELGAEDIHLLQLPDSEMLLLQ